AFAYRKRISKTRISALRRVEKFELAVATTQVRTGDEIRNSMLEELKWDPKITSESLIARYSLTGWRPCAMAEVGQAISKTRSFPSGWMILNFICGRGLSGSRSQK